MTKRRRAREIASQALYQAEHGQSSAAESVIQILRGRKAGEDVSEYARHLVEVVEDHREQIDEAITGVLDHWDLNRLAAIDRSVLRIAAAELLYLPDVPAEVVIDEAVEIAKKYSTGESGGFVNGVLDRLWRTSPGRTSIQGGG